MFTNNNIMKLSPNGALLSSKSFNIPVSNPNIISNNDNNYLTSYKLSNQNYSKMTLYNISNIIIWEYVISGIIIAKTHVNNIIIISKINEVNICDIVIFHGKVKINTITPLGTICTQLISYNGFIYAILIQKIILLYLTNMIQTLMY